MTYALLAEAYSVSIKLIPHGGFAKLNFSNLSIMMDALLQASYPEPEQHKNLATMCQFKEALVVQVFWRFFLKLSSALRRV